MEIAELLKERGMTFRLDTWNLEPGLTLREAVKESVNRFKSVAVFIGKNGEGAWNTRENSAFLREMVKRKLPVLPVLLPDSPKNPPLPLYLKRFARIDFHQNSNAIATLVRGISG
jgi:hypothetical protein